MPLFRFIGSLVLSPLKFIGEVAAELKKVTWPTRAQTVQSTFMVVALSLFVGVCISGFDFIYTKAISLLLK